MPAAVKPAGFGKSCAESVGTIPSKVRLVRPLVAASNAVRLVNVINEAAAGKLAIRNPVANKLLHLCKNP